MKKIAYPESSHLQSHSLRSMFQIYCQFPRNSFVVGVHGGSLRLIQQSNTGFNGGSAYSSRGTGSSQGRKNQAGLFSNVIGRLERSEGNQWLNSKQSNQNISFANLKDKSTRQISSGLKNASSGSKSPLKTRLMKQKNQISIQESAYKIKQNVLQSKSKNQLKVANSKTHSNFQGFESSHEVAGFQKIASQIINNINEVDLSFQNIENFVEHQPQPEQKIKKSTGKASLQVQPEGQSIKINIRLAERVEGSSLKQENLPQKISEIKNPYAKDQNEQKIEQKKEQVPLKREIQPQKSIKSEKVSKLTDEQVCQIISSRKKAIADSRKKGQGEEKHLNEMLSMSDLDINALLKIEDEEPKVEAHQPMEKKKSIAIQPANMKEQKTTPAPHPIVSSKILNQPLYESFVPYYKLHPSPRNENNPQASSSSSFVFIPSNINTTKPTESRVYEPRRLSQQSEQPSSLVFQLSANSNF